MTRTRIYYSPVFGIISLVEIDNWFCELTSEMNDDDFYWHYIGMLE